MTVLLATSAATGCGGLFDLDADIGRRQASTNEATCLPEVIDHVDVPDVLTKAATGVTDTFEAGASVAFVELGGDPDGIDTGACTITGWASGAPGAPNGAGDPDAGMVLVGLIKSGAEELELVHNATTGDLTAHLSRLPFPYVPGTPDPIETAGHPANQLDGPGTATQLDLVPLNAATFGYECVP